jgi:cyclic-di-GMP phosphodiesterase TipF (flagellum assembly factor)
MNTISAMVNTIFSFFVRQSFRLDFIFTCTLAALLILVALQVRSAILRARGMREIQEAMDDLRAANAAVKSELEDTKRKVAQATLAIATKSDSQERKITGELQIIESLVREFAHNAVAKSKAAQAGGTPAPHAFEEMPADASPDSTMLEIIRRALEENRVDLYLQPVVGLPQRKTRFFEALSRLRSEDGTIIMPSQYIKIAAPAGLMSVVDNLLLFRCVQIVRRLTQKHREIAVFCNISGHTLNDPEFFPQFLDFMHHHRDLAGQIIFEFTQDDVLAARPSEEANLRYLANLGFKLSMDQVTKLDFDFARARKLGFQFLKLRAQTLISGMKLANAPVAAEDFKDLLARNGLNLIVEQVEDEKTVVQLLEYNVDFGQGYLFGEPRPVRDVAEVNDPRAVQPSNVTELTTGLARRLAG